MEWLWGAFAGLVGGAVVAPLVEPWSRRLQSLGRRAARESPVDLHVERNRTLIFAGDPPWESFAHYFPGDLPSEEPPEDGRDWGAWAARNGGVDMGFSVLLLTVVARTSATVVVQRPVVEQATRSVPVGVGVLWPALGGAELVPRQYEVRLETGLPKPLVTFRESETDREASSPSWSLAKGEAEQLHIYLRANGSDLHEWTIRLPLLVDGRRVEVPVRQAGGAPFITVGYRQPHRFLSRMNSEWQDYR